MIVNLSANNQSVLRWYWANSSNTIIVNKIDHNLNFGNHLKIFSVQIQTATIGVVNFLESFHKVLIEHVYCEAVDFIYLNFYKSLLKMPYHCIYAFLSWKDPITSFPKTTSKISKLINFRPADVTDYGSNSVLYIVQLLCVGWLTIYSSHGRSEIKSLPSNQLSPSY